MSGRRCPDTCTCPRCLAELARLFGGQPAHETPAGLFVPRDQLEVLEDLDAAENECAYDEWEG